MKSIFRVGDTVRIVRSRFIRRVGYPLVWTEMIEQARLDIRSMTIFKVLHRSKARTEFWDTDIVNELEVIPMEILRIVAHKLVEEGNYGGNQRQLIYDESILDAANCTVEILEKKIAKTGIRVPHSSWINADGYREFEPGGLENERTHILLRTHYGWIENINLEHIKSDQSCPGRV